MKTLIKTFILCILFSKNVFAKDWQVVDYKKFISLEYSGIVTHGDKLNFNFSKRNCDRVSYYFSMYSAIKNPDFMKLKGKSIPLNINGIKTWADTIYTSPFLMGYRGMFYLGTYNSKEIAKFFNRITNYQIKVVNRNDFNVEKYFDIHFNKWNLSDSKEAFDEAYNLCKSKTS